MKRIVLAVLAVGCAPRDEAHVVFICEHGAAKSVIAAAQFNRMAADRGLAIRAIARGAEPQAMPSNKTADGLRGDGLEPPLGPPQPLTAGDVRDAVSVIAFDCDAPAMRSLSALGRCWNDVPPIGEGYDRVRDRIRANVSTYMDELRHDSDRLR